MNTRGGMRAAAAVLLLLALTACGASEPAVMPDVVGSRLDLAKSDIERAGFRGDVEVVGGGLFGVIDEGNWVVCEQVPAPGESLVDPRLVVDRECTDADEPAEPEQTEEPADTADAIDTTVDELLDRLNSAGMGGIQVGDRFRFTGELVRPDLWYTGRTGEYIVLFTAHGGADDLMVFVDESETIGWADGTRLDVVVENIEVTLDGETTDGWLRVLSATVVG